MDGARQPFFGRRPPGVYKIQFNQHKRSNYCEARTAHCDVWVWLSVQSILFGREANNLG